MRRSCTDNRCWFRPDASGSIKEKEQEQDGLSTTSIDRHTASVLQNSKTWKVLVQWVCKRSVAIAQVGTIDDERGKKKAGIQKKGSIHTLRNCYTTHHLENGTDLVYLQEQLGHNNLRTTIKYIGLCVERKTVHPTSDTDNAYGIASSTGIGELFRQWGQRYISIYKPCKQHIKLINAIRVCRTPALGGIVYTCSGCGAQHFVYKSCGHSHCMMCQSIKREQWMDKLNQRLLKVPYIHTTFTIPHQLNGLFRMNQKYYMEH